ncbi:hypothetical protein LTR56_019653 [Elasticomyces elasticus]|nr:hypothetical protein LTR56_019653 [Elasticomyces elasticus]KAK3662344.1 hypothetical protein LTR22_006877 [Elasticomyces elasticus]KAK5766877.1 hypothetical protein LTS12_002953 [Elasticomyces elasticus]
MASIRRHRPTKRRRTPQSGAFMVLSALLASSLPTALAQTCISLADSTACPAFNASSVSTDSTLVGLFPFLSSVTDTTSFDSGIQTFIANGFTQTRYETLIGCSNVNLDNTTDFYARYTTSVLCNAIIQNSISACDLSGEATRPLCAGTCASYAQSEEEITSSNVCGTSSNDALTQIRADFTNCALPSDSLTGSCIEGEQNEPNDCGYSSNLGGLCSYCSASSPNATDSCCVFSNTTGRCTGVTLPIIASSSLQPVTLTMTSTMSATSSPTSTGAAVADARRGLTAGQLAGVVVGSVLGALLLLALLIVGCLLLRKRRGSSPATSVFNQPATLRQQPQMAYNDGARDQERAGLAVLPGGRVARMSALEGSSSSEQPDARYMPLGYGGYRKSTSDEEGETPESRRMLGIAPPPKRSGSLSSGSQLAITGVDDTSPSTDQQFTSPESHGQSEQLAFFKDYYSQDEIHPADIVSTLWAYEPRAADEFQLDRGDMIKVLGIWDDGWATGVRVRRNAEDWRPDDKLQRDSGMSTGSSKSPDSPDGDGEVKAFPLVCVCLPQHWRKTIEGDSTEGSGPHGYPSELP